MAQARLIALILFFLLALSVPGYGGAGGIRLHEAPGQAWIPSPLNDYSPAALDKKLYVAWTGPVRERLKVFLSRVDLESLGLEETRRVSFEEWGAVAPQLAWHQGRLYLAWLAETGPGRQAPYTLNVTTLEDLERGAAPVSFEYGSRLLPPRLVSTPRGLFVVGASHPPGTDLLQLRLFRNRDGVWDVLEGLNRPQTHNEEPLLLGVEDGLVLAWVRNGNLVVSRSDAGDEWSEPVQLATGLVSSLSGLVRDDAIYLSWVERDVTFARLGVVRSLDGGRSWQERDIVSPVASLQVNSSLEVDHEGRLLVLYSYWGAENSCDRVEVAEQRQEWRITRLSREEVCGRSLSVGFHAGDNTDYVVWQERGNTYNGNFVCYRRAGEEDWSAPVRIDQPEEGFDCVAPKLFLHQDQVYYFYFVSEKRRMALAGNVPAGDLYVRPLSFLSAESARISWNEMNEIDICRDMIAAPVDPRKVQTRNGSPFFPVREPAPGSRAGARGQRRAQGMSPGRVETFD